MFTDRLSMPLLPNTDDLSKALNELHKSRMLSNDSIWASRLESSLAEITGRKHCILFSSASTAMDCLIFLHRHHKFDVCPYTWITSLTPHRRYDTQRSYFDLKADQPIPHLTPDTIESETILVTTHAYGIPPSADTLTLLERRKNLVFFDGAHALGVTINEKPVLSFGDAAVISLHPTKGVTAAEGGAIVTDHEWLATQLKHISRPILASKNNMLSKFATNVRMSELNALYAFLSLDKLTIGIEKRRQLHDLYTKHLNGYALNLEPETIKSNFLYCILDAGSPYQRDVFQKALSASNIASRAYFSEQTINFCDINISNFPNIKNWSQRLLAVPLHHEMSDEDVIYISNVIKEAIIRNVGN